MKPSFAIVGCGRVGTALAVYLTELGYPAAGLSSKSLHSSKKLANTIGTSDFSDVPCKMTKNADIVFITTPDDIIESVCDEISAHKGFHQDATVLHCSGSLPSTILSAAKGCKAVIGSLHPLQSFASTEFKANPFQGIIIAVEGEKSALEKAGKIAGDLGGNCLTILTETKTLYHASAVVASNYLVTLMDFAFKLINQAGISSNDALMVLKPLVNGTLLNIEKDGIPKALTGPIARGDVDVVKSHIEEITSQIPELLSLYKILGSHTVEIADAKGSLSKSSIRDFKQILE